MIFRYAEVAKVLDGYLTRAIRWQRLPIEVGEVVAAVSTLEGRSALLTPLDKAFTHLRIWQTYSMHFRDLEEHEAMEAGFKNLQEAKAFLKRERL